MRVYVCTREGIKVEGFMMADRIIPAWCLYPFFAHFIAIGNFTSDAFSGVHGISIYLFDSDSHGLTLRALL